MVADGGDEFAVGGLAAVGVSGVAEVMLQDIGVAANPANLNGMADGALYPGGSGMECSGHIGIEGFGDRGAVSGIMEHQEDSFPDELIAAQACGDAAVTKNLGNTADKFFAWNPTGCIFRRTVFRRQRVGAGAGEANKAILFAAGREENGFGRAAVGAIGCCVHIDTSFVDCLHILSLFDVTFLIKIRPKLGNIFQPKMTENWS